MEEKSKNEQKQEHAEEETSLKEDKCPQQNKKPPISSLQRFARYLLVGGFTALLSLGTLQLAYSIFTSFELFNDNWRVFIAETFSVIVSCVFSFMINSRFTFEDRKARRAGIFLYILFYAVVTPLGSWFILWLKNIIPLADEMHRLMVSKLIKMVTNLFLDYVYIRFFIFAYLKKKFDV